MQGIVTSVGRGGKSGRYIISVLAAALAWAAAPPASAQFCAWAQQVIAGTGLTAEVTVHETYEAFVESKAFDKPFTVQQLFSNSVESDEGMPRVVSCKMRTAERINEAHAEGAVAVAQGDTSCQEVHRQMLDHAYSGIPEEKQQLARTQWAVDEEDMTYMGPRWLEPWPFQPLSRGEDGKLHLQTRALYVPMAWWIPMPEHFLGNYYCHLIAPNYLRALIRGELQPGV